MTESKEKSGNRTNCYVEVTVFKRVAFHTTSFTPAPRRNGLLDPHQHDCPQGQKDGGGFCMGDTGLHRRAGPPESTQEALFFVFCFFFVFFFFILGLHLKHIEVPRLGVELELQLPAYSRAHSNAGSLTP